MRVLTDPAWLGAIGSILAIVISLYVYRRQKNVKSLSYEILSENPLLSVDAELQGKIQVLYNGNPLENIHLILIRFTNDGNIPILASDYENNNSIIVKFKSNTTILSVDHIDVKPSNLTPTANIQGNIISVSPLL